MCFPCSKEENFASGAAGKYPVTIDFIAQHQMVRNLYKSYKNESFACQLNQPILYGPYGCVV